MELHAALCRCILLIVLRSYSLPAPYTNLILTNANVPPFVNTLGALGASGQAVATIAIPPGLPGISGLVLHHAFVALDGSSTLVFVSEPAALAIVP